MVPLSPAVPRRSGHVRRTKTGPVLGRIALDRRLLPSELRLECGNLARQEVRARGSYWWSYSNYYSRCSFMYIFVCVPVAGRIVPAITRIRVGLLLARSPSELALV